MTCPPTPATETRTLLTFPTEGLPSPHVVAEAYLRAFPVRSFPARTPPLPPLPQVQTNRWLCCRCAESGYTDPVGMVYRARAPPPPPDASPGRHGRADGSSDSGGTDGDTAATATAEDGCDACWRPACRHALCTNCALFAGPLASQLQRQLRRHRLIRTVGGLHASPGFVDPVFWECRRCGEWRANRFDSRSRLGATACLGPPCAASPRSAAPTNTTTTAGAGLQWTGDGNGGVLDAESVVMNRYGQRLGSADQRMAVKGGPWDWQRRALADPRCVIMAGLRAVMRRDVGGVIVGNGSKRMSDLPLWKEGEPVPHYPYRRPPPLDENDADEYKEYEDSYLAGMPTESRGEEKGVEQTYWTETPPRSSSPMLYEAASPVAAGSGPPCFSSS
ncbi:Zinc-finger domain-containing protein [Madurella fahalii]|uniref:Zinc-finger domain-containing protein n=1 Tax=Madurella fahalii TaxID=1157608 RepID=A0ABQ0GEH8_9PEZI